MEQRIVASCYDVRSLETVQVVQQTGPQETVQGWAMTVTGYVLTACTIVLAILDFVPNGKKPKTVLYYTGNTLCLAIPVLITIWALQLAKII